MRCEAKPAKLRSLAKPGSTLRSLSLEVVADEHLCSWMSIQRPVPFTPVHMGRPAWQSCEQLSRSNPAVLAEDFQILMASWLVLAIQVLRCRIIMNYLYLSVLLYVFALEGFSILVYSRPAKFWPAQKAESSSLPQDRAPWKDCGWSVTKRLTSFLKP